ncbi:MAG: type IV secretion system protein TraC [Pseudomonadota bacterium]
MSDATGAILSPVLAYKPDRCLFLCDDRSLGFAFDCMPRFGASESVEKQLRALLEDEWPTGACLQILLHATPNLVKAFDTQRQLFHGDVEPDPASFERRQAAWFQAHTETGFDELGGIYLRRMRLVISAKMAISDAMPSAEELELGSQLARRVERNLHALELVPERIDAREFLTICSEMVNRGPGASWRRFGRTPYDDDQLIRDQILDIGSEIVVDRDGIALEGGGRLVMMSPKGFHEQMPFTTGPLLINDILVGRRGLHRPFFIALNVEFRDQQSMRSALALKTAWTTNAASGGLVKWLPAIATRHRDFQVVNASMENGHRPVKWSLSLGVYGADVRSAEQAASDAVTYWAEQNIVLMKDRYIPLPLLINAMPLGLCRKSVADLGRFRTMTTEHVGCFVPVYAAWQGTPTPVITPIARDGTLMGFDLFDSPTNYNAVVAAGSGSGKSFLLQLMIRNYLACGSKVWVIDVGGSYRNLCERLDGEYIDFADRAISMNPFSLITDWDDEQDLLQNLLGAMASQCEPLTDIQRAGLSACLAEVWKAKGASGVIDDLIEALSADPDQRVRDVAKQLYEFSSMGIYGRYFAGSASVSFTNAFTVVELGALQGRAQLQRIVLLQLIFQIQQAMTKLPREKKKLLFIDEAWELLTDGEVGRFIENGYRRFRKHAGAMVIATQSLGDLFAKSVGVAIADNSAHKLLLQQGADTIDRVVKEGQLSLPAGAVDLLKSVRSVRGRYSEVFFHTQAGMGIGRIVVDPATRLLFSTTPEEVAAIDHYRRSGMAIEDAVDAVLEDRTRHLKLAAE